MWLNTTSTDNTQAPLQAVLPNHPVFTGVSLDANNQVDILTTGCDLASTSDAGNGTLIARRAQTNEVWIVEWETGQEFYTYQGRVFFCGISFTRSNCEYGEPCKAWKGD